MPQQIEHSLHSSMTAEAHQKINKAKKHLQQCDPSQYVL